jgi:hypothetical protein
MALKKVVSKMASTPRVRASFHQRRVGVKSTPQAVVKELYHHRGIQHDDQDAGQVGDDDAGPADEGDFSTITRRWVCR